LIMTNHKKFNDLTVALNNQLEKTGSYLLGDFSALDCIVGYTIHFASLLGWLKDYPILHRYYDLVKHRHTFIHVLHTVEGAKEDMMMDKKEMMGGMMMHDKPVLYHMPKSRSTRVLWLVKEMGIDIELKKIDMTKGEHKNAEFLKINPNGKLPALVDGDLKLFESFAIIQHLLEKYDSSLLPSDVVKRSKYFQFAYWAASSLDDLVISVTFQNMLPTDKRNEKVMEEKKKTFHNEYVPLLENQLTGEFLLGSEFTALDVIVGYSLAIADKSLGWLDSHPRLKRYAETLFSRSAFNYAYN